MRFLVIAEPPEQFAQWEQRQLQPLPASSEAAKRGEQVFLKSTCANCHAIRGTSANVAFAPDLTHLAQRQTLAAGVTRNGPRELARWLKNPQAIKPGTLMPNLQLTDEQVAELVAYLEPGGEAER